MTTTICSLSPEALFAGGRGQWLGARRLAEDGSSWLHREDEVEVSHRHGKAGQEGQAEAEGPHAAAKRCCRPVDQPADTRRAAH